VSRGDIGHHAGVTGERSVLERIVGAELTSVTFERAYLQLTFEGDALTARLSLYCWPAVQITGERLRDFGSPGYRDGLYGLIGHSVSATKESEDAGLVIDFPSGAVRIQPRAADLAGPEVAMFETVSPSDTWMVWRPGEYPFENLR
jgi:hypothetical protein